MAPTAAQPRKGTAASAPVIAAQAQQAPFFARLALAERCQHPDATPAERQVLAILAGAMPEAAMVESMRQVHTPAGAGRSA